MEFLSQSFSVRMWRAVTAYFRSIDVPLFGAVLGMGCLAALNLYGIGGADHQLFQKQLVFVGIGGVLIVLVSLADYRVLRNYSAPVVTLYALALALLLSTLAAGAIRNVRSWLSFGGFTFEPVELMKLALIVLLAKYFSQRHRYIGQLRHILVASIYAGVPALIVLVQPDLGSAVILVAIWGALLLAAGINKRHLFALAALGLVGIYFVWVFGLKPYQHERILAFLNPYQDPTGIGYHIIQAKIAIGSGGWLGAGLGKGSQVALGFLPEPFNDFAFAAFAEQFGFVGMLVILGGTGYILWRILRIGERGTNNFVRLFAVGVTVAIGTHALISASVNLGIMPITGIPFSFLSYGGSHWMVLMVMVGILQSMKRHG